MNHSLTLAVLLTASMPAAAQLEASTLAQLARRSPLVFVARVDSTVAAGGTRTVVLSVSKRLRGKPAGKVSFSEPVGAHCGSTLAGLMRHQIVIVFARSAGDRLVVEGGRRGILTAGRGVEQAVTSLITTKRADTRARLLASQLSHGNRRVREDAALALAIEPGLERVDADSRQRVLGALAEEMKLGNTNKLVSLLTAATRIAPATAARSAWQLALAGGRLQPLAERMLTQELPAATVSSTVPQSALATTRTRLTLTRVLAHTKSVRNLPLLRELATDRSTEVRTAARQAITTVASGHAKPVFRAIRPNAIH